MLNLNGDQPKDQLVIDNTDLEVSRKETKSEGEKTLVSYDVEIDSRSFKVTVGFSKERLEEHFADELAGGHNVVSVIDKIVNRMSAEDLIKLSGHRISANLNDSEDTQIESLENRSISTFEEIKQGGEKENVDLANTVKRVVDAFQKNEVGKLVRESIKDNPDDDQLGSNSQRVRSGSVLPGNKFHHYSDGLNIDNHNILTEIKIEEAFIKNPIEEISQGVEVSNIEGAVKQIAIEAEHPQLEGADNSKQGDRFKNIEKTWTYSDRENNYALTERIERIDTGDRMNDIAEAELTYLQGLNLEELGKDQKTEVETRIELLNEIKVKNNTSWADSDFFRDILRGNSELNSKKNSNGIQGAVEEYTKIMNEQYYTRPLAVNMRYHSCEIKSPQEVTDDSEIEMQDFNAVNKTEGWVRAGVMSCMDNGFVNQEKMVKLSKALDEESVGEANTLRKEMTKEIFEVWQKEYKKGNKNIDASAGYALTQLGYSLDEVIQISTIVHKVDIFIENGRYDDIGNEFDITENNIKEINKDVNEVVKKRNDFLANQFLQLIMEQLEHSTEEDLKDGLKMIHVGLLNHDSRSVDGTGWYHNEEQEMRDMAYIMSHFDNTNLICDGTGPYIDENEVIHLPVMSQLEGKESINLRSVYVNQSVQGHTRNDGAQFEINEQALEKLTEIDEELAEELTLILTGKKSGYSSAADVVHSINEHGHKASTGCLSAKDRTGGVSLLVTDRVMAKDGRYPEKMRARVRRNQLLSSSPAVKVIRDCTGTKVMKISPLIFEGISDRRGGVKGVATRIGVYFYQGWEILKENERVKRYEKEGKQPLEP